MLALSDKRVLKNTDQTAKIAHNYMLHKTGIN